MATWVVRVGRHGEHQKEFLDANHVYLTWNVLQDVDLSHLKTFQELRPIVEKVQPQASVAKVSNHASQVFAFVAKINFGDVVVSPLFDRAAVAIGETIGPYQYDRNGKFMYRHSRAVRWISTDVPRSRFQPDLLHALLQQKTVFQINAQDADKRFRELAGEIAFGGPAAGKVAQGIAPSAEDEANSETAIDLERRAKDDIANLILRKFKGRGLERLIEGMILLPPPRGSRVADDVADTGHRARLQRRGRLGPRIRRRDLRQLARARKSLPPVASPSGRE